MATLKAFHRSETGSRRVRRLRKAGRVPAIIYGHGEPPEPVSLDRHDIVEVLRHGARLLELDLDGSQRNVLVKDLQYDAFGQDLVHLDLARVRLDERVEVTVPVVLRGRVAEESGVLTQTLPAVRVECLVTAIPDDIRVSVAELKLGESIKAGDLPLPEGAKLLDDPSLLVCTISVVTEAEVAVAAPEVAAAEPEVIGEKKEAEEEEGPAQVAGQ